eukprot:CAMPEP_0172454378 /NCGR_PEP_ID=MMETSP1065-20121228/11388_1 /TAXON_ID=265537 /ORGANISM="Amphiprora paludosa, Strain CCMP125" /LENGTH=73 /DNA_ID=CAMNT_0013206699 /DNA_START=38 /DNA_END=256 /DNA_ORIENTATION=+
MRVGMLLLRYKVPRGGVLGVRGGSMVTLDDNFTPSSPGGRIGGLGGGVMGLLGEMEDSDMVVAAGAEMFQNKW